MSGGTATLPLTNSSIFAIAALITNARPASLGAMAQRWSDLATIATNSADGMDASLNTLMQSWQSSQAQPAFESNTRPLIGTLRSVSTYSGKTATLLQQAETDLQQAQTKMAALLAQANALIPNGPLDYANAAGQTTSQQLAALTQQAIAIIQALSGQYDAIAAQIASGTPVYAGPAGPGAPASTAAASQNPAFTPMSQIPTVQSAAAAASSTPAGTTAPASTSTSTSATTPTIPTVGTTVPTSTTIPTSTLPTSGGTTTVPTIPTVPTIGTSAPTTAPTLSALPDTFLPASTLGLAGGYGGSLGTSPDLATTDAAASQLPSQSTGAAVIGAEPSMPGETGVQAPADSSAGMPFFPGMPGAAMAGTGSGRRGPRLGGGLFDDEPELDDERRAASAVRHGVIEAEEPDLPISAYGTVGARRERSRASGADDGLWALPTGLAAPILADDPTYG